MDIVNITVTAKHRIQFRSKISQLKTLVSTMSKFFIVNFYSSAGLCYAPKKLLKP